MKVSELIARLQMMPQELEVMLPCESGVNHAMGTRYQPSQPHPITHMSVT
ncbi:hypothetical protein POHY109586_19890 [Polaromonas hydrogenivorans]